MNLLEKYRTEVEDELRKVVVKGRSPLLGLDTMLAYHLGFSDKDGNLREAAKGKYLRSLFCMAICEGLGGDPLRAVPAAASIELAHRTSLIFDDIQDKGKERNNQPTVWSIWGVNQAINAGFSLSSYAHLALQNLRTRDVPDKVTLEVWSVLEKAILALCQGQFMDISFMEKDDITVDDYLGMVRGKTGTLFAIACEIGAMIAVEDRSVADLANEFGMNMGVAFQIHDDYLGIWGDEDTVGKTANDLIEKKRSLPIVLALEKYPEATKDYLNIESVTPNGADLMKQAMEKDGIPDQVVDMETMYADLALSRLEKMGIVPKWYDALSGILRFVIDRKK